MSTGINLPAIYIANTMGVLLCLMTLIGNRWKIRGSKIEKKVLRVMITCVLFSCVADPIIFTIDGHPGKLMYYLGYIGNFWLFFSNMIIGPSWLILIFTHIEGRISKWERHLINFFVISGTLLLIINFFTPIVFTIDENNVYSRGPYFWFYSVVELMFIMVGILCYVRAKIRGGVLQFFPVWQFIMPVTIGCVYQTLFYGISTIWPSLAVSICGLMNCLTSEVLYRDYLTGLYNRSYLDIIKEELTRKNNGKIAAMMLDLNGFKSINDVYGHLVGDEALIEAAGILRSSAGSLGNAIRYAGDEFLILLNTDNVNLVEECVKRINDQMDRRNRKPGATYQLSVSIGYTITDLTTQSIDQLLNEIDHRMYENKKKYYKTNPGKERRKNR